MPFQHFSLELLELMLQLFPCPLRLELQLPDFLQEWKASVC